MSYTKGYNLKVWNPFPGDGGIPTTPAGGGSWVTAAHMSICIVAFLEATEDWDSAGWILTIPANWKDFAITTGDKLVVSWTWPAGLPTPDHFGVYWQAAATFTLGAVATRALLTAGGSANIPGSLLTATLEAPGTATGTIPSSYTNFNLDPVVTPGPKPAPRPIKGLDIMGIAFKQTFAFTAVTMPDSSQSVLPWFSGLTIPLFRLSTTDENRRKLVHWSYMDNHLVLEDSASGDYHELKYIYGALSPVPSLNVNCKGEEDGLTLEFLVEGVVRA